MADYTKKIVKKDGSAATEAETRVAKELASLEGSHPQLKDALKGLTFNAVKEVELGAGRKATVIVVPFPQLSAFRKIQKGLIEELEKKLGGHVLVIANRTMMSAKAWSRSTGLSGVRPRNRSLKAVQEALLDDLVFPTEITGKRTRVRSDSSRLLKVYLNPKDQAFAEGKVDTFRGVYKMLTQKDVTFTFN